MFHPPAKVGHASWLPQPRILHLCPDVHFDVKRVLPEKQGVSRERRANAKAPTTRMEAPFARKSGTFERNGKNGVKVSQEICGIEP